MRLRGGRDFNPDSQHDATKTPHVAWLPIPGVLSKGVRLRLRLDRRDNQGRDCWHLVDLETETQLVGQTLKNRGSDSCPRDLMSTPSVASEMQTPVLGPQFTAGPTGKLPGRKRGRPPIRKFKFQDYTETLSPLKIPKRRGRKPGVKLKPRMVTCPLANSPANTPEPEMGSIPQDAAVPHPATSQILTAETSMPGDFPCDSFVDSKRYAVNPSDSAFGVKASQIPRKLSYSYRGSSSSSSSSLIPMGLCRQALSTGSFPEGNRNAYGPVDGNCKRPAGKDPSSWGVEEVVWFIKDADPQALGPHAEAFRKHEIDGDALLLLKCEMMMKYLGLKLGPALKLCYYIDRLKQNR